MQILSISNLEHAWRDWAKAKMSVYSQKWLLSMSWHHCYPCSTATMVHWLDRYSIAKNDCVDVWCNRNTHLVSWKFVWHFTGAESHKNQIMRLLNWSELHTFSKCHNGAWRCQKWNREEHLQYIAKGLAKRRGVLMTCCGVVKTIKFDITPEPCERTWAKLLS